ncbi:MAG: hypothetical protein ACQCXQ_01700 [Verrucomicrobiales bacterium]
MNSDPHDSAAWRSFGMLSSADVKQFEDAATNDTVIRDAGLEIDRIATAIAVATTPTVTPDPGQLDQLHKQLGFNRPPLFKTAAALSGWILAAALAALLIHKHQSAAQQTNAPSPLTTPTAEAPPHNPATPETERLTKEISHLRETLATFQTRDDILFSSVPGHSMQIVMVLTPPDIDPSDSFLFDSTAGTSPLAALLGKSLSDAINQENAAALSANSTPPDPTDTLPAAPGDGSPSIPVRPIHGNTETTTLPNQPVPPPDAEPTLILDNPLAIPIYDPARDAGSLVVSKLPPSGDQNHYNLWVTIEPGTTPIFIGSLPDENIAGARAFDFSLGSTLVPSSFTLTLDLAGTHPAPSDANTVLTGPSLPAL